LNQLDVSETARTSKFSRSLCNKAFVTQSEDFKNKFVGFPVPDLEVFFLSQLTGIFLVEV
jgi:hypothetical protein